MAATACWAPGRVLPVERGFGCATTGGLLFSGMRDSHGVQVTDIATGALLFVIGTPGSGDGQFNGVRKMCIAGGVGSGGATLFVADQGNGRVQEFTLQGAFIRAIGCGVLNGPHGVAVDDDVVAVTEWTGHRISLFSRDTGTLLRQFGGAGSEAGGCLSSPCGLIIDPITREIVVVDQGNHRVCVYSQLGEVVGVIAAGAGLSLPGDVAFLGSDRSALAVVDKGNNRVVVIGRAGDNVLQEDIAQCGDVGDPILSSPTSIAVAPDGAALYVLQREAAGCCELLLSK